MSARCCCAENARCIHPDDIDHVHAGGAAKVRLSAFDAGIWLRGSTFCHPTA
jgi:hypothetical protein